MVISTVVGLRSPNRIRTKKYSAVFHPGPSFSFSFSFLNTTSAHIHKELAFSARTHQKSTPFNVVVICFSKPKRRRFLNCAAATAVAFDTCIHRTAVPGGPNHPLRLLIYQVRAWRAEFLGSKYPHETVAVLRTALPESQEKQSRVNGLALPHCYVWGFACIASGQYAVRANYDR